MLKYTLPKLEKDDLVGRETYTHDEILDVIIPYPPPASFNKKLYVEKMNIEEKIKKMENMILKDFDSSNK